MNLFSPEERKQMAREIAMTMGFALNQSYQLIDGMWWLLTNSVPKRILRDEEVKWHKDRNHKPFIEDGIDKEHPDWWTEPALRGCESGR